MKLGDLRFDLNSQGNLLPAIKYAYKALNYDWINFETVANQSMIISESLPIFVFESESELDVSDDLSN